MILCQINAYNIVFLFVAHLWSSAKTQVERMLQYFEFRTCKSHQIKFIHAMTQSDIENTD